MSNKIILLIIGMTAVTYLTRMPLLMLSGDNMPPFIKRWLSFVPPAILSALIAPSIFLPQKTLDLSLNNHYLFAAIITTFVAYKKQNLLLTIILGVLSLVTLKALI